MHKLRITLLLGLTLTMGTVYGQKGLDKIVVGQDWMQKHLDDKNLVVLHVRGQEQFDAGHIKGSQMIDASEYAIRVGNLSWEIPHADSLNAVLRGKGISNKSKIVLVHGADDHAATFRLYFTLDYYGLSKNAVILDGGLKGWKFKGLETTVEVTENSPVPEGGLKFKTNSVIKVDKDYVKLNAGTGKVNVIDARRANFYEGAEDTRESYKRSGHVSGAGNVCWLDIVDENLFMKDYDEIRALYTAQGVNKKEEVVAYCHVGLRASVIYTVAKGLGFKARLYDGSYNEWDTLSDEYLVKVGKDKK